MCFECKEKTWYGRLRESKLRKAKKDITCYKVMIHIPSGPMSLFTRVPYMVGAIHNSPFDAHKGNGTSEYSGEGSTVAKPLYPSITSMWRVVNIGFHSFIGKPEMKMICGSEVAVRCVIPKGTLYRKNTREYVSDSIKVIEILNE